MSEQSFDQRIRQALEGMEAEYNPSDWDRMSQRLDEEELIGSDEALDETVQSALVDYRDPSVDDSWDAFRRELEYRDWREAYFISKVAESFILLLLFITFFHLIQPTQDAYLTTEKANAQHTVQMGQHQDDPERNPNSSTSSESNTEQSEPSSDAMHGVEHPDKSNQTPDHSISSSATDRKKQDVRQAEQTMSAQYPELTKQSVARKAIEPLQSMVRDQRSEGQGLLQRSGYSIEPLSGMSSLVRHQNQLLNKDPVPPIHRANEPESTTWISAFASSDVNTIHSPYDSYYELDGYTKTSLGYGFGLALEWKHDNWVMGTGFAYSKKSYQPRKIIEVFEHPEGTAKYMGVALEQIGFEMMSLPISMRTYIYRDGTWSVFAGGSMQLHLVTRSDYDRLRYPVNMEVHELSQPAVFSERGNLKLNDKPAPEGLMEGGSFFTNSYFSLDLSVGIEYRPRPGWMLFAQPVLMHSLINQGLGPNQDKIQTFSLRFGVRTALD